MYLNELNIFHLTDLVLEYFSGWWFRGIQVFTGGDQAFPWTERCSVTETRDFVGSTLQTLTISR